VERVADRVGIMVGGVLRVDCRTETFRESVRKIVLEFVGTPPDSADVPGLISCRQVGTSLDLVLVGYDDDQRVAVEQLRPQTIEVLDLNLEDAFIEYTRGSRRSLPLFATENEDAQSARIEGAA
jgi:ABC-2 type transport system ATP-binding protein